MDVRTPAAAFLGTPLLVANEGTVAEAETADAVAADRSVAPTAATP